MIDYSAKQAEHLAALITQVVQRAHDILKTAADTLTIRRVDDDGLSMIERLKHSPWADDQIFALVLREASACERDKLSENVARALHSRASSLEIEGLRRTVMAQMGNGCVAAAVDVAIERLCREAEACHIQETSTYFRSQADLYADLWCDPRIDATVGARKTMLVMVTRLHKLSHKAASLERP